MSDSVKQVWRELADQIGELGSTIHERLRDTPSGASEGGDTGAEHAALREALDQLVLAGKQLGERLGDVARDDEVRQRAKAASSSLDAALTATVDRLVGTLQDVTARERNDRSSDTPPDV
jgi:hypothetical protein